MAPPGGCARTIPRVLRLGFGRTNAGDCSCAATAEREISGGGELREGGAASLGGDRAWPDDLPGVMLGERESGWAADSVLAQRAVSGPMVGGEKDERDEEERMRSLKPKGIGDSDRIGERDVVRHGGM